MSIVNSYFILDIALHIECKDSWLNKKVTSVIRDYFCLSENRLSTNTKSITLQFRSDDNHIKVPTIAQELFSSTTLRVLKDGDICYLIRGNSIFKLNLEDNTGIGFIDPLFWEAPFKSQQEFFMLALIWLFRNNALYAIHGNTLVNENDGTIILGDSGSGKSTAAIGLIRAGWKYLADDIALLQDNCGTIEALAFTTGFSIDPDLANRYEEFNLTTDKLSLNGQKKFLNINDIYPDRFVSSCVPKTLIFSEIVPEDHSRLIPIDRTEALVRIAMNSGGIMIDKDGTIKQFDILKKLIKQASSYKLFAGRDIYKEPRTIAKILLSAI